MQVLNDVHTTRCQGVPQGKQAEEHLASCTGTVVDDDVPGSLGNQGILIGQLGPKPWGASKYHHLTKRRGNNQEMEMGLSENLNPNQYGSL